MHPLLFMLSELLFCKLECPVLMDHLSHEVYFVYFCKMSGGGPLHNVKEGSFRLITGVTVRPKVLVVV